MTSFSLTPKDPPADETSILFGDDHTPQTGNEEADPVISEVTPQREDLPVKPSHEPDFSRIISDLNPVTTGGVSLMAPCICKGRDCYFTMRIPLNHIDHISPHETLADMMNITR